MSYSVAITNQFKKEVKKLIKKYRSLKDDLKILGEELEENPTLGIPLGNNIFKSDWQSHRRQKANPVGQE